MSLTVNHDTSREKQASGHTPSAATTPVPAVIPMPFSGRLVKVGGVVGAAFTGTMSVAVAILNAAGVSTTVGGSPFTLSGASSAAGTSNFLIPLTATDVTDGDVLILTPSGATGAAVPMNCFAMVRLGL